MTDSPQVRTIPDSGGQKPHAEGAVFRSTRWNSLGAGCVQLVRLGVSLVLFDHLGPSDVGLMAMALVVVGFLDWFKDFGTGQAVVQAKTHEPGFLSTVFYVNLLLAVSLSTLIWVLAEPIAWLFDEQRVADLLPLLGLSFVITAFGLVQRNLYARAMRFDRLAFANMINAVVYGVVAIGMALNDYGVWSMVVGTLVGYMASNLSLWFGTSWRPELAFSLEHLNKIKGFCLGLLGSNMANFTLQNMDRVVIGRFLGTEALGLYALGLRLINFPVRAISRMLMGVLLPAFARLQEDLDIYHAKFLRACAGITMIVAPMMAGLAATAPVLVEGFMKPKWLPAVPIIIAMTPLGLIYSVSGLTGTIYVSLGRTTELFRWSLIFGLVSLVGYAAGLPWGVFGVACSASVTQLLLVYFYFAIPFRMIGLSVSKLATCLAPFILASGVMGTAVVLTRIGLSAYGFGPKLVCLICVGVGVSLYVGFIWRLRPPALRDLVKLLGVRLHRGQS
ncbi:MAG: O-antigen/teichoic acid export membrane protein [Planctomycetota bacterium]